MRRIFVMFVLVVVGIFVMAQTNQLVWNNARLIYGVSIDGVDSLTYGAVDEMDTFYLFMPKILVKFEQDTVYVCDTVYVEVPSTGTSEEAHEFVDLGLSVKWATCNVGASKPEEYGDYFAWGEVEPKNNYSLSTYKYCNGTNNSMTKYSAKNDVNRGEFYDNKIVLGPEDDAAAVNWGGEWRMPTKEEQDELRNKCTWEWTTLNGVKGYAVIGINRNVIFLPAAGCFGEWSRLGTGVFGYYWSSSLYTNSSDNAYYLGSYSDKLYEYYFYRYFGLPVRAVCRN